MIPYPKEGSSLRDWERYYAQLDYVDVAGLAKALRELLKTTPKGTKSYKDITLKLEAMDNLQEFYDEISSSC